MPTITPDTLAKQRVREAPAAANGSRVATDTRWLWGEGRRGADHLATSECQTIVQFGARTWCFERAPASREKNARGPNGDSPQSPVRRVFATLPRF
jgi:hypothetical protein